MGDKTTAGRVALTKISPSGGWISKVPCANTVQDVLMGYTSQFAQGYRVGKLHQFEHTAPVGGADAGLEQAAARMEHSGFMSRLIEAGGKDELVSRFNEIRAAAPDMPVGEAFAQAARKFMPDKRMDAYEAWHQLTGQSLNAVDDVLPFAHPQLDKEAAGIIDQYADLGVKDYVRAQDLIANPK